MKRFIAIAATTICCLGNEMPAKASIQQATRLIESAAQDYRQAASLVQSGNKSAGCSRFKQGLDKYANAYVLFPHDKILFQMIDHQETYDKHC
jgi:hypothetical protein